VYPLPDAAQTPAPGCAEILAAATDLFGEAGFDAASISAIAQRAETSKANVFHHFGSKEALYLAVMRNACNEFAEAFAELDEPGVELQARLGAFMRRDIELMHERPDQAHLIMREVLESGPRRGRTLAGEVFQGHFTRIVALFAEGQRAGVVADDVPPAVAAVMTLACNVFLFQSKEVLHHMPGVDFAADPERYAALASRVLLDGVRRRDNGHEGERP